MSEPVARAVAALKSDPDLRYYLAMRCGHHPDVLAMSVAGRTIVEVATLYRAKLTSVLREAGPDAVDASLPHLETFTDADGQPQVRILEDAFDTRPMFHGVQLAVRATVAAAAEEAGLENRVLTDIAACLLSDGPPIDRLPDAEFDALVRIRARGSERCTGSVNIQALDFTRSVANDAIRRANLAAASLTDIERMLRLREAPPTGVRLPSAGRPLPVVSVFRDGIARLPVNHAVWALQNAIRDAILGVGWTDDPDRSTPAHVTSTNKGRGSVVVSLREPHEAQRAPSPTTIWEKVRSLDDLTADALLVCLAHWAAMDGELTTPVWISADAILDARGIQRIRKRGEPPDWQHGHRREDRLAAGRALAQLDNLWLEIVDVEVTPRRNGRGPQRMRTESRALAILDRITERDSDGNEVFLAARVVPGAWARSLWEIGLRQTGVLASQALAYDPYRARPERWLARYMTLAFRWNASHRAPHLQRRVSTLLQNAALVADPSRPQRTRDRLERALDRLAQDGLIGGWRYVDDVGTLPARRWLASWTTMLVQISPPNMVRARYAAIRSRVTSG